MSAASPASSAPKILPLPGGEGRGEGGRLTKPFFSAPGHVARLQSLIPPWLGTPFLESCGGRAKPGVSADCCWIAVPLQQCGAIGAVPWPSRYVSRGGGPAMLEKLLEILDGTERLMCIWSRPTHGPLTSDLRPLAFLPGDVLLYTTGTRLHHLGLLINATQFVHSWSGKIQLASVADQRERFLFAVYRAYAP